MRTLKQGSDISGNGLEGSALRQSIKDLQLLLARLEKGMPVGEFRAELLRIACLK